MNSNNNTNAILSSAVGLVQRLAATIPTLSSSANYTNNSNIHQATAAPPLQELKFLIHQLLSNLSTSQSLQDLFILTIVVVIALEILNQLVYHVPSSSSSHLFNWWSNQTNNNKKNNKNKSIPVRGKHLDNFTIKDYTFIMINKCMTGLFVYCYFGYLWSVRKLDQPSQHQDYDNDDTVDSHHADCCHKHNTTNGGGGQGIFHHLTFQNTLLPLPLLFLTYDFFYTLLHWSLHMKSIYAYIHKHHHYQKAPSRANIDAVNVHPLEFFLGEFNHILALKIVLRGVQIRLPSVLSFSSSTEGGTTTTTTMALLGYRGMDVSWLGAVLFIGLGGILAGLNHTRHDVVVSVPTTTTTTTTTTTSTSASSLSSSTNNDTKGYLTIFDSKHHDVHHRIPQSNYGQYTVFWDRIFGTFRDYDENDPATPDPLVVPSSSSAITPPSTRNGGNLPSSFAMLFIILAYCHIPPLSKPPGFISSAT
ncbi:hypothetical protein ACHAXM_008752 [Skeletonema potamos]